MTDRMDFLSSSLERQTCKLSLKLFRVVAEQLHRQQHEPRRPSRMVRSAGSSESATEGARRGMAPAGSAAAELGSSEEARARRCGPASTAWNVPRHSRSNTTLLFCSRRGALPLCILIYLLI